MVAHPVILKGKASSQGVWSKFIFLHLYIFTLFS